MPRQRYRVKKCVARTNLVSDWEEQAKEWKAEGVVANILGVFIYKKVSYQHHITVFKTLPQ